MDSSHRQSAGNRQYQSLDRGLLLSASLSASGSGFDPRYSARPLRTWLTCPILIFRPRSVAILAYLVNLSPFSNRHRHRDSAFLFDDRNVIAIPIVKGYHCRLLFALFHPNLHKLENRLHRRFHSRQRNPLGLAVVILAAGEDVGCRQAGSR